MYRLKWPVNFSSPFKWAKSKLGKIGGVLSSIKSRKLSAKTIIFICVLLLLVGANSLFWAFRASRENSAPQEDFSTTQEWEVNLDEEHLSEEELRQEYAKQKSENEEVSTDETLGTADVDSAKQERISNSSSQEVISDLGEEDEAVPAITQPKLSTMALPVVGKVITEFAVDKLVYSKTLEQWGSHYGIDIAADLGTAVKATMEGTVVEIRTEDPRLGVVVVLDHGGGIQSLYGNLASDNLVEEGKFVKKGQVIGAVGNTAPYECADPPHLHFELLKDGKNIDPLDYLPKVN